MMGNNYTLITGASGEVGRTIATILSVSRTLLLSDRNEEVLGSVQQACHRPKRHAIWVQDMEHPNEVRESLTAFIARSGQYIEHFVHSANTCEHCSVRSVSAEEMYRVFNVNLFAAIEIVRQLVRTPVNRGTLKTITVVSSILSHQGAIGRSVYAASKGALNALVRSLAVELAPDIRVNAILCNDTTVDVSGDPTKSPSRKGAGSPFGPDRASDLANAVEFISSEKARWVTGQEVIVDGVPSPYALIPALPS